MTISFTFKAKTVNIHPCTWDRQSGCLQWLRGYVSFSRIDKNLTKEQSHIIIIIMSPFMRVNVLEHMPLTNEWKKVCACVASSWSASSQTIGRYTDCTVLEYYNILYILNMAAVNI